MVLGVHPSPVRLLVRIALGDLLQHLIEGEPLLALPVNRTVFGLPSGFGVLLREVPAAENDIPYRVLAGTPYYLAVDLQRLTDVGAVTVANPFRNVSDGTAVRPILRAFRVLAEELAILAELDYRTGQVLDAIDAAGVADNTIVVWSSDNPVAPAMAGSNGPWRGNFASGSEGGMRAPAMVRWPGKVAVGRVTDEILSAVDWLPTLAGLVGERDRVPTDRPIDGVDASASCSGRARRPDEITSSTSVRMPS